MSVASLREFIRMESAGGILLVLAASLALIAANSPLATMYDMILGTQMGIHIGMFAINKPALLWINDGLMAIFFFLVGLEIKRELIDGQLSNRSQFMLPLVGAIGGIVLPSMIYSLFNWGDSFAMSGWAIPAATDIAFALGVMALLGPRVPAELKLMLLAIAIIDDLGAIMIIALFYTDHVSTMAVIGALFGVLGLFVLSERGITKLGPYLVIGAFVWVCVLKSGVHATLAGVLVAAFMPLRHRDGRPWTEEIEHNLHPWIAFAVLPIFAFANAGVSLEGIGLAAVSHPISLGIIAGLVLGKQLGVFGAIWLAAKLRLANLPPQLSWSQVYGMSVLCGVGFTMSLFIGSLAFEETGNDHFVYDRLGILTASILAAVLGYLVLRLAGNRQIAQQNIGDPGLAAE